MAELLSTATITTTGLLCKAFLNSGLCSITVSNLHILLDALRNDERRRHGQGVVTVANHISTLDDPLVWGTLPVKLYLNSNTTRWSLGASDIMFTNPLFSAFFRKGQVLETFRGNGIFQPSVDIAIKQLNEGHWVHLFGEGKVNQPPDYPRTNGVARLPRFKWGVGRILMETAAPPLVIPMWLTGFDKLMPEHRLFPYKYFPRLGIRLGVVFGDPIPVKEITAALTMQAEERFAPGCEPKRQMDVVRSNVTAIVQRAVEALGRQVSGNLLNKSG
ncbi:acyltransferase-domain-containing protein [Suillus subaureus]|uniref:Tafazzin family protein n=1 Tax=Suillus subaureus TaxID=48587 RepID=A0A9P7JG95_9AGAM|nr:acyltransferase-domain-containing protein [Suillus subaureus]KAG1820534.1 acyltransferase-domain-containing protein [Suillus subaureus]